MKCPCKRGRHIPPKRWHLCAKLYGVTSCTKSRCPAAHTDSSNKNTSSRLQQIGADSLA